MSDEQIPVPSAADPQVTPIPAITPETSGTQNDAATAATDPVKREPWFQKRIDELTRARREAERERDALQTLIESRAPASPSNPPSTPGGAADGTEIMRQARLIADQQRLNEDANRVYREGKTKHPDFDNAVQQLAQIADLSQKPEFLEAVTRLPNGADLYHHLGTNPDLASEVLSLKGTALALEMAKLSAEIGKPIKTSAPPPTTNVGSSAVGSNALSDDLPMDEWIRRREAQLKR